MMLSVEEERAITERIVRDHGNGSFKKELYLFDQIRGSSGDRSKLSEALHRITANEVVVLLDRHPNNRTFAQEVMKHVGMVESWAFVVSTEQLEGVLGFIDCDMYVTSRQGCLLLVGCHEDERVSNDRTVWLPHSQPQAL
jgi:hypothetical protein